MFKAGQKVRFKTEAEFIAEFGKDWRNIVNWNTSGDMDHLFWVTAEITSFWKREVGVKNIDAKGELYWIYNHLMFRPLYLFWEEVEVRDNDDQEWEKRIYVGEYQNQKDFRYICVCEETEDEFKSWLDFETIIWNQIRPIAQIPQITELTLEQIAEKFGVDSKNIRIKE